MADGPLPFKVNRVRGINEDGLSRDDGVIFTNGNSGSQAINLAFLWGAKRIILVGFDFQATNGQIHWHGNHRGGLPNLGRYESWTQRAATMARELRAEGVEVINCSRRTALTCFERRRLVNVLGIERPSMVVHGMHGLGDNLHQRAIVRQLMVENDVWLETPWPSVYHDMEGLHLVNRGSKLRTQAKNAEREAGRFSDRPVPQDAVGLNVSYPPAMVRQHGSVLRAMARGCGVEPADFRMPVPDEWKQKAADLLVAWGQDVRPLMIYRPLVERSEWGGCKARNPHAPAYDALFRSVRDRFFVVSVADLEPGKEWLASEEADADVKMHAGQLDFQTMAGLISLADLVFSSPGFAVVLAQAVGTRVVAVFGGYENSTSFREGAKFSPYLGIDPISPCNDFAHHEHHDKRIDIPAAIARLAVFVEGALPIENLLARPIDWQGMPTAYSNPGEIEALVTLAEGATAALEIGCNSGRTSRLLMANVSGLMQMVGIDVPPGYAFANAAQRNEVPTAPGFYALDDHRFRLVVRPHGSQDVSAAEFPEGFDFIFIDGDHSKAAVEHDTELARKLIRPGGVIAWHDYHWQGNVDVREVLEAERQAGADIRHVKDTWIAIERH